MISLLMVLATAILGCGADGEVEVKLSYMTCVLCLFYMQVHMIATSSHSSSGQGERDSSASSYNSRPGMPE